MLMTTTRSFDSAFLRAATGGTVHGRPSGRRVVTDSRSDLGDARFVALTGPHFDGHDFVGRVLDEGATGVVVSKPTPGKITRSSGCFSAMPRASMGE